jgi:hypothetical protein
VKIARQRTDLEAQRRTVLAIGILTQVHLSLGQYYEAAQRAVDTSEIMRVQEDLLGVTRRLQEEGRTTEGNLISSQVDTFFATVQYLEAYSEYQGTIAQIKNTVGRAAELPMGTLPVRERTPEEMAARAEEEAKKVEITYVEDEKTYGVKSEAYQETLGLQRDRTPTDEVTLPAELKAVAAELANGRYSVARQAKEKLIEAGPQGAAAALEMLNSINRRARILAILVVREVGTARMVASLLPALSDPDPEIRYQASMALKSTFQQDFGYFHNASEEARGEAVNRWEEFLFAAPAQGPAGQDGATSENGAPAETEAAPNGANGATSDAESPAAESTTPS